MHFNKLECRGKVKDLQIKEIKNLSFFICFYCWAIWQNNNILISLEHLTNSRLCTILTSQLENVTTS